MQIKQNAAKSILLAAFIVSACTTTSSQSTILSSPFPTETRSVSTPTAQPETVTEELAPPTVEAAAPTAEPRIPSPQPLPERQPVHGIILFVGDGMGPNQRLGAQWLSVGQDGKLFMDLLPVQGWQETAAANRAVTDSAAAATALATGVKANYRAIGMDSDYNAVPTILELTKREGWSVGLVTTVQIAHATPAGFAAHVKDRSAMTEIASQILANEVDVLLGGGEDDFLPRGVDGCFPGSGNRDDGRNLIEEAVAVGYMYVCTPQDFLAVDPTAATRLIGLFGGEEMIAPYAPSLAEMTRTAIEILSQNPKGFFLMVEAGQIDWAGHDSIADDTIQFTLELDKALIEALSYYGDNPNTLMIVTADHETGGMILNQDDSGSIRSDGPFQILGGGQFWVDWEGRGSHTPINVQVSAQGPYAEYLDGTYPNTFIFDVMYSALTGGEPGE